MLQLKVKTFVDVTLAVAAEVNKEEQNLGIVIDAYGAGPFMGRNKKSKDG